METICWISRIKLAGVLFFLGCGAGVCLCAGDHASGTRIQVLADACTGLDTHQEKAMVDAVRAYFIPEPRSNRYSSIKIQCSRSENGGFDLTVFLSFKETYYFETRELFMDTSFNILGTQMP